jgi:hypothetical protein
VRSRGSSPDPRRKARPWPRSVLAGPCSGYRFFKRQGSCLRLEASPPGGQVRSGMARRAGWAATRCHPRDRHDAGSNNHRINEPRSDTTTGQPPGPHISRPRPTQPGRTPANNSWPQGPAMSGHWRLPTPGTGAYRLRDAASGDPAGSPRMNTRPASSPANMAAASPIKMAPAGQKVGAVGQS